MKAILVIDVDDVSLYHADVYKNDDKGNGDLIMNYLPFKPMPQKKNTIIYQCKIDNEIPIEFLEKAANQGYNTCIDEILSQHVESVENALEITDEEADLCGVQFWHDD